MDLTPLLLHATALRGNYVTAKLNLVKMLQDEKVLYSHSEEDENWIIYFEHYEDGFLMLHRYFPFGLITSGLEQKYGTIIDIQWCEVDSFESPVLSIDANRFDISLLDWHTSVFPDDPLGVDLKAFSAAVLFYATV